MAVMLLQVLPEAVQGIMGFTKFKLGGKIVTLFPPISASIMSLPPPWACLCRCPLVCNCSGISVLFVSAVFPVCSCNMCACCREYSHMRRYHGTQEKTIGICGRIPGFLIRLIGRFSERYKNGEFAR